jgi:hypothetical protein
VIVLRAPLLGIWQLEHDALANAESVCSVAVSCILSSAAVDLARSGNENS